METIQVGDFKLQKDGTSIIIKGENGNIITSDYVFEDYIQDFYERFI